MEILKKYFNFIPWIIIIVLLSALVVTQCSKSKVQDVNHDAELKQAIQVEKKRVVELANREEVLRERLKQDSLKNIKSLIAYKRENTILRQELKKARIPVQVLIDSIPSLDAFVDLQDSLIKVQEALIDSLQDQKSDLWITMNNLISIEQSKTALEHEKGLIYLEQRNRYKKKSDKRFIVGPSAGFDYKLQPTFGVSVTYRLLRF